MIPKIIIQTWKTKKLPNNFKKWSLTWKTHNPDFTFMFFDDNDCYKFIYKHYQEYINLYESLSNIEKADIFRYLALHYYGGIYVDIDTICLKPIYPLIDLFSKYLITGLEYENPQQYLQWFIACPKGCSTMIELVKEINKRTFFRLFNSFIMSKNDLVYYTTGPVMYTHVLKQTKEPVAVMEKGKLGCYEKNKIDKNSYLQHIFYGSWKNSD
jgi:mannosyltransferase OCH1-like enzyme